jgi:hypothetical protein
LRPSPLLCFSSMDLAVSPPRKTKKWSSKEDQYITKNGKKASREEMATHLGRSVQSVKARCHHLGVKREGVIKGLDGVAYRKWTPEEEERLAALCGSVDLKDAASLLGRTPDSIHEHSKGMRLDWSESHTFKCIRDVCKDLGVSRYCFLRMVKELELPLHTESGNRTGVPSRTIARVREELAKPKPPPKKSKPKSKPKKKPKKKPRKKVKKVEASVVQDDSGQAISTQGEAGKEFLRNRVIYARAFVFLETLKSGGISVSVWEVMRKVQARKPWATGGDLEAVVEAAVALGLQVKKEGKDFLIY